MERVGSPILERSGSPADDTRLRMLSEQEATQNRWREEEDEVVGSVT